MFLAPAHSFHQQARLAVTLAWVAGYTNILTVLLFGTVTSHLSGTVSLLGSEAAEGEGLSRIALLLVTTFLAGAMLSGLCLEVGRLRRWQSIYVLPIAIETGLLALFAIGLEFHLYRNEETGRLITFAMLGLASGAMGIQNATITRISHGVVRTTHVTGVLTDIGLESVQFVVRAWQHRADFLGSGLAGATQRVRSSQTGQRLVLLAAIILTFALGAGLGAVAHNNILRWAMFPPVLFLCWIIFQDITRPIASIEAFLEEDADDPMLPESLAVFTLREDVRRGGRLHHMPDFFSWSARLHPATRIVILDLGNFPGLDVNSLTQLASILSQFRTEGRRLLLVGLGPDHAQVLRRISPLPLLPGDLCPDMEMALLHGLALAHAREE